MKITTKEWIIDILGVILILLAFYKEFFTETGMDTWQFAGLVVLGVIMIAWTAKKISTKGFSLLSGVIKKKFGS